jgi:superfamily II DNA or RNA helicase
VTEVTVYRKDGIYIPIKPIKEVEKALVKRHHHRFYEERACKKCENRPERHNDLCDQCPAFLNEYKLANRVIVNDNKYLRIPIGTWKKSKALLETRGFDVTVKNKAPETTIKRIRFLGKFREGQGEAVEAIIKKKRGILTAPPRSGKTVTGTAAICRLQRKTLILASQRDWLRGFHETFVGSKKQKPLTDIDPKRIGFCKKFEDFKSKDVCLATVQTFRSEKGQKLLARIASMFEVIFVDEAHFGAADKFLSTLSRLNCRWLICLTGTPDRKDGKFILVEQIVGPIIFEIKVDSLQPHTRVATTSYEKTYKGNVPWVRMVSSLENDKKRLKEIAKWAIKDVDEGHMILIPFAQVKPVNKLVQLINELAGRKIAHAFTGKEAKIRDDLVDRAREYKLKVLVGQQKIISTGINIPRASMLYETVMSSNNVNAKQRMMRVLTAYDGKPAPCVRFFLDNMNVRRNCMRNEYFNVYMKLKPVQSDKVKLMMETYFKKKPKDARIEL